MEVFIFYALILIFSTRLSVVAFSLIKNKKRGAIPLFIISALCLISPFLSILVSRLILFL